VKGTFRLIGEIEAEQRAAAFAYYALFSLFPLVALMLTVGSLFFPPAEIIKALEYVTPLAAQQEALIWQTVASLEKARGSVSIISLGILLWASMRFFQALVRGVNRAWHTIPIPWWQMPLKNIIMLAVLGGALILGILIPAVLQGIVAILLELETFIDTHFPALDLGRYLPVVDFSRWVVGTVVLFYSFSLLYLLAPRRRIRFSQVWLPALLVAVLLQLCQQLFVNILPHIINYNRIYGPVGGLMFLLMWIYVSGLIILSGACLCAAMDRRINEETDPPTPSTPEC